MNLPSKEQLIIQALEFVKEKGIKIKGGSACFNWMKPNTINQEHRPYIHSGEYPHECSAIGACYLYYKLNSLTELCKFLNIGFYWVYRFHQGFDRGRQLQIKDKEKDVYYDDETSKFGIKLANKYC